MKEIPLGEGQRSFPFFSLITSLFFLVVGTCFSPLPAICAQTEKEGLTPFDRMAEEATLLNKRGQYDQVISLLEPHKNDKKNDSALFFNELGVAYRSKGNLPEAIRAYREALTRDPENPVVMKNLADAFYFNKEYSKAAEQCQKALRSNPRFHQAHFTLGLAYYRLGKYPEALEEFETVLQLNPQDELAKNHREAIRKKLTEQRNKK
jgi:tetratricopeptide (TPR) repeat protein